MQLDGLDADCTELRGELRHLPGDVRCSPEAELYIDPGFINIRLATTLLASVSSGLLDKMSNLLADCRQVPRLRHPITQVFLEIASRRGARTLAHVCGKSRESVRLGELVCSFDEFRGKRFKKDQYRADAVWIPPAEFSLGARLEYSIDNVLASTTLSELQTKSILAHLSRVKRVEDSTVILEPIILGGPWVRSVDGKLEEDLTFHHFDYGEVFIEDIDEFRLVRDSHCVPGEWLGVMGTIPELAVKICLCELLGGPVEKDWGGEEADMAGRLTIRGRTANSAIMLKGPSKFVPMSLKTHFGKNADQLVRLADSPADLIVIQHCHVVPSPVLKLVRAVSLSAGRSRRYLVIDGKDTFRILSAYDKIEWCRSFRPPPKKSPTKAKTSV